MGVFTALEPFGQGWAKPNPISDPINTSANPDPKIPSEALIQQAAQAQAIQGLCFQIMSLCQGGNQQWSSLDECVNDLSLKKFGTWDNIDQDTVTCRFLHFRLVPIRPQIHCFHVGPDGLDPNTGKGKCTDKTLLDLYSTDYLQCSE